MNLKRIVSISLWVTAPVNIVVGYALAFPAGPLGELLELPTASRFYTFLSGALVALFGLVYAWMATQANIPRSVLFVGACGKLIAVLVALGLFVTGQLSGVTASFISGDILFVALWCTYLLSSNRSSV